MTRGLILLDDAAVGHAINDGDRRIERSARIISIASVDSGNDLFDLGANQRAQARIVSATLIILTGALSCLR